jgi:hypothetical protein
MVFQYASPVILAILAWLSTKLAQLIGAKVKNEYLRGVLARLDDAVFAAVRDVHQVLVEELKAASADGRLTPEERARAKKMAIDKARSYLGTKGLAELCKVLGLDAEGIENLLGTRVEATVHDLKRSRASGALETAHPFAV